MPPCDASQVCERAGRCAPSTHSGARSFRGWGILPPSGADDGVAGKTVAGSPSHGQVAEVARLGNGVRTVAGSPSHGQVAEVARFGNGVRTVAGSPSHGQVAEVARLGNGVRTVAGSPSHGAEGGWQSQPRRRGWLAVPAPVDQAGPPPDGQTRALAGPTRVLAKAAKDRRTP